MRFININGIKIRLDEIAAYKKGYESMGLHSVFGIKIWLKNNNEPIFTKISDAETVDELIKKLDINLFV